MATLKTNYKDDILDTSVNTQRKYRMVNNADGTISLEDVTVYTQNGDSFGAADINKTNQEVLDLNSSLFKHYDYTELVDGSTHWRGGCVNIIKQGKVVIASVMLYFETDHTPTECQLLSMPMLKAINCEPKYLDTYYMQTMNKVGIGSTSVSLSVSNVNEVGLFIFPMGTVQAGDHFRAELVWVTS